MNSRQPGDVEFSDVMKIAKRLGEDGVRVVVFREEGAWVAQCLEYDVNAQGDTTADAMRHLANALIYAIALDLHLGKNPLADVGCAPDYYWGLYAGSAANDEAPPPKLPSLPDGFRVRVAA